MDKQNSKQLLTREVQKLQKNNIDNKKNRTL